MLPETAGIRQLLLISGAAGSLTPDVRQKLIEAFPLHHVEEFNPEEDFLAELAPGAAVVVAGGDGTTAFVARKLAGSGHPLGILPLGTFNNFARSLKLPLDVAEAIQVIKHGQAQAVTVGRLGGRAFLEAASAGLAGLVVEAGEALKDLHFGELGRELAELLSSRRFEYRLSGDLEHSGNAFSLTFANTPSIGALIPLADTTPREPSLTFVRHPGGGVPFRRAWLETEPPVEVYADNTAAGYTPMEISADSRSLEVILPAG